MRRGIVIAVAILGLSACGRGQNESATSGTTGSATGSAPTSAPAAAAESAAKPDVGAAPNEDVTSCLDLVGTGSYEQAVPICNAALNADPANEKVKAALETAQAKVAAMASDAAQGAADAAQGAAGAAEDAADQAKDAVPTPPKPY
jgi:hypothetical protein